MKCVEKQTRVRAILLTIICPFWLLVSSPVFAISETKSEIREGAEEVSAARANRLLEQRKWDEALPLYRALYAKDSKSTLILSGLSIALLNKGQRTEALNLLIDASHRFRNVQQRWVVQRVKVLARQFLTNSTFQTYQDGLNLLVAKNYRFAQEHLEKALVGEPDNVEVLLRLGQCLILAGDASSALPHLRLAKKLSPFEPQISLWLGRALQLTGSFPEAQTELNFAWTEMKGSEFAPLWLAETLLQMGQGSQALRLLEADFKKWRTHVPSMVSYASTVIKSKNASAQDTLMAQKVLRLAMLRMEDYLSQEDPFVFDLGLPIRQSKEDLRLAIQTLIQQVQSAPSSSAQR